MAGKREPAIIKDFRRGPVFFRLKKNALAAKESATKHGIRTRLRKTSFGWKLSQA